MNLNLCVLLVFACSAMEKMDFGGMQQHEDQESRMIEMSNFEGRSNLNESTEEKVKPFDEKWAKLETDEFKVALDKNGHFKDEKFNIEEIILKHLPIREINCLFNANMWRETINDASKYQRIIVQNKKKNQITLIVLKGRQEALAKLKGKMAKGAGILLATTALLMASEYLFPLSFLWGLANSLLAEWRFHQVLAATTVVPQLFLLTAGKRNFMQKMISSDEKFWKNTERRIGYSYKLTILAALINSSKIAVRVFLSIAASTPYHHYEHTAIHHRIIPGTINWEKVYDAVIAVYESFGEHSANPAANSYFDPLGESKVEPFHRVFAILASVLGSSLSAILFGIIALFYFIRFIPFFFLFFSVVRKTFSFAKRKID